MHHLLLSGLLGTEPVHVPLSPPPPSRNSEKPEGLQAPHPYPGLGSSWMEQLGRRDLGVWNMVI